MCYSSSSSNQFIGQFCNSPSSVMINCTPWQTCLGSTPPQIKPKFSSQQFQFCQKGANYRTGQSITVLFQICILHLTIDICLILKLPTYFKPNKILNSLKNSLQTFFCPISLFHSRFFSKRKKGKKFKNK